LIEGFEGGDPDNPPPNCDPAYPNNCIKSPPPDLDCGDIQARNFYPPTRMDLTETMMVRAVRANLFLTVTMYRTLFSNFFIHTSHLLISD
jgi:hypothetical protein